MRLLNPSALELVMRWRNHERIFLSRFFSVLATFFIGSSRERIAQLYQWSKNSRPAMASGSSQNQRMQSLGALFLGNLTVRLTFASAAQFTGKQDPMIGLLTDFEKLSPISGDDIVPSRAGCQHPGSEWAARRSPASNPKISHNTRFTEFACCSGIASLDGGKAIWRNL